LNDPNKTKYIILFVGNEEINIKNKRLIILRNLPYNIENEKDLLTFTAWYAIIKNNLFSKYEYICILEYDVILDSSFQINVIDSCIKKESDIISFIPINHGFFWDIKEYILKFYISQKNLEYTIPKTWYATTNHCIKRNILTAFVDWYYPSCQLIKKLDSSKISWYHERLFSYYINYNNYTIEKVNGLSHNFSNSHKGIHNNLYDLSKELIELYINNPSCEFLIKLIDNYTIFINLLKFNYEKGIGSYLTDGQYNLYDHTKYNKQKLLYETAKKSKEVLIIGDYRNHVSFIMLLANPLLKITCIENESYISNNIHDNITIIKEDNHDKRMGIIENLTNIDFMHISQIYPEREILYDYLDIIIKKSKLKSINLIIDDVDVYPTNFKEVFLNSNIHCRITKETKSKCIHANILLNIQINNKYILLYNDDSGVYDEYINKLEESIKKYSNFQVIIFHKKDINTYFKNTYENILNLERGGGYWLWKPYIINETFKKMQEGDILFYMDSKYSFLEPFDKLLTNKMKQDIIVWKNKPNEICYPLKQWCKMDVIQKYNLNNATFIDNYEICWAGAIVFRKTSVISSLIKRWLELCCIETNLTDSPSMITNSTVFIEHRHDQSLLSVVLYEFNIKLNYFEKKYLQNERIPF
jgi:hypothetical protein